MMMSAEDRLRNDLANLLNRTTERRILAEGEVGYFRGYLRPTTPTPGLPAPVPSQVA